MTHEMHVEQTAVCGAAVPVTSVIWTPRVLTTDELSRVNGAGNIPAAILGALKGAVGGGVASAAGAMSIGAHWPSAGISGMVSGGIGGAIAGFGMPRPR